MHASLSTRTYEVTTILLGARSAVALPVAPPPVAPPFAEPALVESLVPRPTPAPASPIASSPLTPSVASQPDYLPKKATVSLSASGSSGAIRVRSGRKPDSNSADLASGPAKAAGPLAFVTSGPVHGTFHHLWWHVPHSADTVDACVPIRCQGTGATSPDAVACRSHNASCTASGAHSLRIDHERRGTNNGPLHRFAADTLSRAHHVVAELFEHGMAMPSLSPEAHARHDRPRTAQSEAIREAHLRSHSVGAPSHSTKLSTLPLDAIASAELSPPIFSPIGLVVDTLSRQRSRSPSKTGGQSLAPTMAEEGHPAPAGQAARQITSMSPTAGDTLACSPHALMFTPTRARDLPAVQLPTSGLFFRSLLSPTPPLAVVTSSHEAEPNIR